MTVQELIDELMKIDDKTVIVEVPSFYDFYETNISIDLSEGVLTIM